MMHGWQSEPTDGPKDGWSCVFLEWLQWSPHPQLLDVVPCIVVYRSVGVVVVVVVVVVVAVVVVVVAVAVAEVVV